MNARPLALPLLAAALSGCVGAPLGTARTLPVGEFQHQLGLGLCPLPEAEFTDHFDSKDVMFVPGGSWTLRTGTADGVEAGVGAHTLGLHGDLKVALHRGDGFAVALDPTIGGSVGPVVYGALPLLADVELGRVATLTLAVTPTHVVGADDFDRAWTLLGLGAGLTLRATDWLALQPGLHWMLPLRSDPDLTGAPLVFAGVGVALGDHAVP